MAYVRYCGQSGLKTAVENKSKVKVYADLAPVVGCAHRGRMSRSNPKVRILVWGLVWHSSDWFHQLKGRYFALFKAWKHVNFNYTSPSGSPWSIICESSNQGFGGSWKGGCEGVPAVAGWFCGNRSQWIILWGASMGWQIQGTWDHLSGRLLELVVTYLEIGTELLHYHCIKHHEFEFH